MIKRICLLSILVGLLLSCHSDTRREKEIAKIPMTFQFSRFDQAFAKASPGDLPKLKEKYPFLFPKQYADSVWIQLMEDSVQHEIDTAVARVYPNFHKEKRGIKHLFQHLKYYYPDFEPPRVITITSRVDYNKRIVLTPQLLLISLDVYLGKDHPFYYGIQRYFTKNFKPSQILPNIAHEYARQHIKRTGRSFIEYMVYYGKLRYFMKRMLPEESDAEIMGYSPEEWKWARENERQIWGYFVEKEMIYKTDRDLRRRFFEVGPFTSFGLDLDNESPAQLGQFMGWQVVNQYMAAHPKTTLKELLEMEDKKLFKESNYKPKQ